MRRLAWDRDRVDLRANAVEKSSTTVFYTPLDDGTGVLLNSVTTGRPGSLPDSPWLDPDSLVVTKAVTKKAGSWHGYGPHEQVSGASWPKFKGKERFFLGGRLDVN